MQRNCKKKAHLKPIRITKNSLYNNIELGGLRNIRNEYCKACKESIDSRVFSVPFATRYSAVGISDRL